MAAAEPAVAPPPGNPRFPLFDGLRAVAALSVLVFHVGFWARMGIGTGGIAPYLARLNVGVAVFFVISGFLLYRPFLAGRSGDGPPLRLRDYARRRVLRIVPAYWVALTVLGLYPGLPDLFTSRWWVYYGFAQDYGRYTTLGGIDVAWTLGCEVVFYALLPVFAVTFAWLAARAGRRLWWQLEVGLLSGAIVLSTVYRVLAQTHYKLPSSSFASTFAWFALGMLLAYASVGCERRGGRLRAAAERYAWVGWPVALGAYVLLCRGLGLYSGWPFAERDSTFQTIAIYLLSGVVAVALALPAAFERRPRSPVGRLLASRALAWLGLISYGIYLYHDALLVHVFRPVLHGTDHWGRFIAMLSGSLAVAVAAGALSYYIVERPILRLKENPLAKLRRLRARLATGPAPEPAAGEPLTPYAGGLRSSMSAARERSGPS